MTPFAKFCSHCLLGLDEISMMKYNKEKEDEKGRLQELEKEVQCLTNYIVGWEELYENPKKNDETC